jgi:hypothetical protein
MKTAHWIILTALLTFAPSSWSAFDVAPAEMQACQMKAGASQEDLEAFFKNADTWFEEVGGTFDWWMATPHYRRPDGNPWSFLMMGFWPNFDEQLIGLKAFYTTDRGREVAQQFSEVMECGANIHFNTIEVRKEKRNEELSQGFGHMFDCTMNEGKTPQDVAETFQVWNAYLDEQGVDHGVTAMFPRTGNANSTAGAFKFLWGGEFENVGKTLELIARDEAQAAWAKIIGKTFACEAYDRGYYFRKISR